MRKNYFLLLVSLFTIALFGQTKIYNYIEEDYIGPGPGDYENSIKTDYFYNPDNTLSESIYYFWNSTAWSEGAKQLFTDYDVNGNLKEQIYQSWNGSQWINNWREVRVFNGNNNPTEIIYYEWNISLSQWIPDTKTTVDYLSATIIDKVSDYTWNGSTYVEDERYSYNYISNKLDNVINITWDGLQWNNFEKTLYVYYGNGKINEIKYQDWNGSIWVDYDKDIYVLDSNFNRESETYFVFSTGTNQDLIEYTYNNSLLLSSFAHPFNNDTFIYSLGLENNPYVNKLLTEVTSSYNGVDWDIVSRKTYNYDNTAGVNDLNKNNMVVYPNPTTNFIYLSNINENLDYKLYDVTGKISIEGKVSVDKKIDLSHLKSGMFFLQLKTETGNMIHRKVFKN